MDHSGESAVVSQMKVEKAGLHMIMHLVLTQLKMK